MDPVKQGRIYCNTLLEAFEPLRKHTVACRNVDTMVKHLKNLWRRREWFWQYCPGLRE
jgi:hypothetical protein